MRKVFVLILGTTIVTGCIYVSWTFYLRWVDNRAFVRRLEERKAARDRAVVDAYGAGRLTILGFYAIPAIIRPGKTAQLCYSVSNSESVRIEPPVKNVWSSLSRCVEVSPTTDTAYTLIAEDSEGNTKTASITIKVH